MSDELTAILSEIRYDIQNIHDDANICLDTHFNDRAKAIDLIDFHIIDRIDALLPGATDAELEKLKQCAEKAKYRLEETDRRLFKALREQIRSGNYAEGTFKKMICNYCGGDFSPPNKVGYDTLDLFINGLLFHRHPPQATVEREQEMVFYQQTPARIILELAERARLMPGDIFFDIGSGLGLVPILVNLLSGAKTTGVECEPAYCDYATTCASKLNLANVAFINTQAQIGDYTGGTVFFMYTPFGGAMMQQMLEVLKKESLKRTIRIFTYGPCSPIIARQSWLRCINGPAEDAYILYEFKSRDGNTPTIAPISGTI
ncbi:hypothetical protein IDJ75_08510 [Mucilaginibacter rigui]|uniref:Methyltransferase domain-containing protein n=1 Tax=Mucilaginibacter rigui TaxID=534635 RepID=A0ABR7X3Z8_9SPHI|nr:hypothetical protein [Mucilaginibacter rigui]MBD1385318.1 hypothetical protein [Mucilaginibacter rigui]